jgi:hypothetical protein
LAGERSGAFRAADAQEIWNGKAVPASSFEVSHDVEAVPVPQLLELFASAWWAAGRTETETRGILAGSDVVVTVTERSSERLVGFARVLTDRTHLALILRWGFTDEVGQSRLMRRAAQPSRVSEP